MVGGMTIELAPLTRDSVGEFVNYEHGGGLQRHSVTRFLDLRMAPVLEDEYEWFDRVRAAKTCVVWGIWHIENAERILIGVTSLDDIGEDGISLIRQATSSSLIFRPDYWGKGIASAAHKARTWYAFQQLGLHCIKSSTVRGNKGSSKALSRSGYVYTYTERNSHFVDGAMHHLRHYECVNPFDMFWSQWWYGEEAPSSAVEARQLAREAMSWAERNVTLT